MFCKWSANSRTIVRPRWVDQWNMWITWPSCITGLALIDCVKMRLLHLKFGVTGRSYSGMTYLSHFLYSYHIQPSSHTLNSKQIFNEWSTQRRRTIVSKASQFQSWSNYLIRSEHWRKETVQLAPGKKLKVSVCVVYISNLHYFAYCHLTYAKLQCQAAKSPFLTRKRI